MAVKIVIALTLAVLVSACTYTAPTKTFSANGMVCSEGGLKVQVSDKVIAVLTDKAAAAGNTENAITDIQPSMDLANLMDKCADFLNE